jgi:hypothetical protein
MLGYKGFHSDLTGYGGFQYEVGKTYTMNPDEIEPYRSGFHFCQYPLDILRFYYQKDDKYALVKVEGKIINDEDVSVTNQMTILQLLTPEDLKKSMPNRIIRKNGTKEWYKEGKLHREGGPAIECPHIGKWWYRKGQLYREDGPAIEYPDGRKEWYMEGQLHCENGPAIERIDGLKMWYRKGQLHREDGPAIEYRDGTGIWYKEGRPMFYK